MTCVSQLEEHCYAVDSGPSLAPRPHTHVMIPITCGNDICRTATNTRSDIIPLRRYL